MNTDSKVVAGFGDEWHRFDQSALSESELRAMFEHYFAIFPWERLGREAVGFDLGCGSGRWARFVAPRVGQLHLIDASEQALAVARRNLREFANCRFACASVESIPLPDGSADFGYSLGVLHHVPDTALGIEQCVRKLRPGAPFLLYLYYAFDNRPLWFRAVWRVSDVLRRGISRMPHGLRYFCSQILAALVYWPLARGALLLAKLGVNVDNLPLSVYRERSFYVMRNDALDRFGTRLEQRFTREQMRRMMEAAGLQDVRFSSHSFWTAVGVKKAEAG
jgi:ubiquinone/menaquinone biosynthesis C-methylase UbiE